MKHKVIAILQARLSSTRLPGKVMLDINGKPMIYWQIKRILKSTAINKLVVAISEDSSDDLLASYLTTLDQEFIRGSLHDVLQRFIKVELVYQPTVIVRLTADCPLVMPDLIDEIVDLHKKREVDYVSNTITLSFPDGLDVEVFKKGVLDKINRLKLSAAEREHVTLGIVNRQHLFSTYNHAFTENLSHFRWTVDTQEDFDFIRKVFLYFKGHETNFTFDDLLNFLHEDPALNNIVYR